MEIVISLPHVFHSSASQVEEAEALMLLLEALVALDRTYLRHHAVKGLYRSGVVYGRTVEWDTIPAVLQRGYGDCKSLTAWRIAELRERGIECRPVFRWVRRKNGRKDFHILVATQRGVGDVWEDPSKTLGMDDERKWFRTG